MRICLDTGPKASSSPRGAGARDSGNPPCAAEEGNPSRRIGYGMKVCFFRGKKRTARYSSNKILRTNPQIRMEWATEYLRKPWVEETRRNRSEEAREWHARRRRGRSESCVLEGGRRGETLARGLQRVLSSSTTTNFKGHT
jgi:hypothetical protein